MNVWLRSFLRLFCHFRNCLPLSKSGHNLVEFIFSFLWQTRKFSELECAAEHSSLNDRHWYDYFQVWFSLLLTELFDFVLQEWWKSTLRVRIEYAYNVVFRITKFSAWSADSKQTEHFPIHWRHQASWIRKTSRVDGIIIQLPQKPAETKEESRWRTRNEDQENNGRSIERAYFPKRISGYIFLGSNLASKKW